jgi:hypothetical protein
MADDHNTHTGGCLCGAIRYRIQSRALQTTLCHCEDCRRASGAPAVAWTFFPTGTLTWEKGTPKTLHHADRQRTFCPDCGSPLTFFDPSIPHLFEANTNTLDHPELHPPADQCWLADALPWPTQNLPTYPHTAPLPGDFKSQI